MHFCHFFVSRFLLLCKISEKTNEQILRKVGYRYTDGQTHGQAWVHTSSSAKGGPKKKEYNAAELLACFLDTSLTGESIATMSLKKIKSIL